MSPTVLSILLAMAAPPADVTLQGRTFRLAEGFVLERVAGPPLVDRPIVADFDERGRLYVADSSGSNDKVEKQLIDRPHRIVRLEDSDGDGTFDRRTVFADKMMFPSGAMWRDGSLYVAAPPSIWKLTDTDGDGIADRREEWFRGKTLTGCANDLHGPYNGPDGRIYWTKGAFAEQTYDRPGKPPLVTTAAHIFRAKSDGTAIEPVMTGGMDNPVEVAFTPGGERFVTATFVQHPEGGRRDGLIHAIYGGVYGKDHDAIDGQPRTGPDLMPVTTHLGPAAPSGLMRYESSAFGEGYRDNLFASLFNMQKITRHVPRPEGSTFATRDEDFLATDDRDFHPTDVLEDADGSLVVVDTGGWYKLCCPTSQIGKPDVLGAIYRIRRADAPKVDDPRGRKLGLETAKPSYLVAWLADPRPAVRRLAVAELARRGEGALPDLAKVRETSNSVESRRNAVWAATRIEAPAARGLVREALEDSDESVRQAALHGVALWRDRAAVGRLVQTLEAPSAPNRRAAAEALGRIGDPASVPTLLASLGSADRVLEHSLIYALIEIDDPKATAPGLDGPSAAARRGAMIAIDQMFGGKLDADVVVRAMGSTEAETREIAAWIAGHHPEWGEKLADGLVARMRRADLSGRDRDDLERQLARLAPQSKVIASRLVGELDRSASRPIALRAMALSSMKPVPPSWVAGLARILDGDDPGAIRDALSAALALPIERADSAALVAGLKRIAGDGKAEQGTRLDALAAIPDGPGELAPQVFAFLTDHLDPDRPASERAKAAAVLARSSLSAEQLGALTGAVKTAGPLEIDGLLASYDGTTDEAIGRKLVEALEGSAALASLRVETLRPRLQKFGEATRARAEALYKALDADEPARRAKLEGLLAAMAEGDVRRGQAIFNGPKAACTSCHAIGYLGGNVGPDLSSVGKIRTRRDLLEAIVYPSASFVRSYEPAVVATKDGRVLSGVVKKDSPEEVVLATAAYQESRISRGQIEAMKPGAVSIMPAGLDAQLSKQELADLIAFLQSRK